MDLLSSKLSNFHVMLFIYLFRTVKLQNCPVQRVPYCAISNSELSTDCLLQLIRHKILLQMSSVLPTHHCMRTTTLSRLVVGMAGCLAPFFPFNLCSSKFNINDKLVHPATAHAVYAHLLRVNSCSSHSPPNCLVDCDLNVATMRPWLYTKRGINRLHRYADIVLNIIPLSLIASTW